MKDRRTLIYGVTPCRALLERITLNRKFVYVNCPNWSSAIRFQVCYASSIIPELVSPGVLEWSVECSSEYDPYYWNMFVEEGSECGRWVTCELCIKSTFTNGMFLWCLLRHKRKSQLIMKEMSRKFLQSIGNYFDLHGKPKKALCITSCVIHSLQSIQWDEKLENKKTKGNMRG